MPDGRSDPDPRDRRLQQMELIGPGGLARLRAAHVAIVGCGNVGSHLCTLLGSLGLSLTLVDRDQVGIENLRAQSFSPGEVGLPKAIARARALRRLDPECAVTPIHASVERLGLGVLGGVTLIVAAVDSIPARLATNEVAMRLGKPWIDTAIDGTGATYTARVAAYPGGPTGACMLCSHDRRSLGRLTRPEGAPGGCPSYWDRQDPVTPPTLAVSALGAAAASTAVIWTIEHLLGRGDRVAGREAYLDPGLSVMRCHRLPINRGCVLDHRPFALTPVGRPVEEVSVASTFRLAEAELGPDVTLRLNRRRLVTLLRCPVCDEARYPYRVLETITEDEARCRQGHLMEPVASGLRDRLGRHDLSELMGRTWAELGLPAEDVITATRGEKELHLLFGPARRPSPAAPLS